MFTKRENEETALFALRWVGRLLSLAFLILLLLFVLGEPGELSRITVNELVGLLFFPVGLAVGFIISWRYELAGGLISLISVVAFYVVYGLLLTGSFPRGVYFMVFAVPAILFLSYGVISTWSQAHRHQTSF